MKVRLISLLLVVMALLASLPRQAEAQEKVAKADRYYLILWEEPSDILFPDWVVEFYIPSNATWRITAEGKRESKLLDQVRSKIDFGKVNDGVRTIKVVAGGTARLAALWNEGSISLEKWAQSMTIHYGPLKPRGDPSPTPTPTPIPTPTPVLNPLTISCSSSPTTIITGQSSTFTASARGGVGPYRYTWSGAVAGNTPSVSKVFSTAGTFSATVTASDGSLQSKQASCSVKVNPAVPASFDLLTLNSSKSVQAGQTTSFDLHLQPHNGFSGQVLFSLSGLPPGAEMASASQINLSGTESTPYALTIRTTTAATVGTTQLAITASGQGVSRTANLTLTITPPPPQPLSASCRIDPSPVTLGQGATVIAQGSGGTTPYRYRINGVDAGTASSIFVMPSGPGTFTSSVTITDNQNRQASSSCSASVVVGDPYLSGFNYTPNPAKAGQVVSLNIFGGNFVSGSTQVWFVGPGCASPGCQTNAVNVASAAYIAAQAVLNIPGTYTVNIRNGTGRWVRVDTVTVVP